MTESAVKTNKSSRTYDAARTREIILDAAEEIFAESGYSAARIDAIAKASGYNKSLIYQYFGDKLGLYTEVVKRADRAGDEATALAVVELLKDNALTSDAVKFRGYLEAATRQIFSFLQEHPRYRKILYWEAAEDWKTWNQITYRPDDVSQLTRLAELARANGIVRANFDPSLFPLLLLNMATATLQSYTRLEALLGQKEAERLQGVAEEQVVLFVVHGMLEPSLL